MIDIKKLRDEFDKTAAELARRGVEKERLEKARDLDAKRRALVGETEQLKAKLRELYEAWEETQKQLELLKKEN